MDRARAGPHDGKPGRLAMLTHLSTQEYLAGLLGTAAQVGIALVVLRGCWLIIRFNHRQPKP